MTYTAVVYLRHAVHILTRESSLSNRIYTRKNTHVTCNLINTFNRVVNSSQSVSTQTSEQTQCN